MKPYQQVAILECGEPLISIPLAQFDVELPHPYEKLGAPYGEKSPYFLRQSVLASLIQAQIQLQHSHPGWRIRIFDAYRPISVQQFMVDYAFAELLHSKNLQPEVLTAAERQMLLEQVYQFWAAPSLNPATPPPHSTGGAVDVTLVNQMGVPVEMGSPIDELSPRSYPDHFAASSDPQAQQSHQNRLLLRDVMLSAGFQRHPSEWWHFSLGDQLWAWLTNQQQPGASVVARYGSVA